MKQCVEALSVVGLRKALLGVGTLALVAMAGCASVGTAVGKPDDIVRARASERWERIVAGNIEGVYHYSSPSYRAIISYEAYRKRSGGALKWTSGKVASVSCQEESCEVVVSGEMVLMVGFMAGKKTFSSVTEKWVLEDGQWWFYEKI